jgi:sigma-54 dependent transcriptional regulator, acetoin dehydrogenase operon transcriptional activator AcoR
MRLERRRLVDDAWAQYVQSGIEPTGIGAEISQSWHRSREAYRIDPAIKQPGRILGADALDDRRRRDEVLALASPVLRDFLGRVDFSGHVLAYFDRDGWMLSQDGDPRVLERLREIRFHPGTSWTEQSAGTNGPGTALAAKRPVEVFASEHFVAAWHPWSCAAAPIHGPGSAAPLGVVDITGPWEQKRREALLMAKTIARVVEERLRAAAGVRDEIVRYALRAAQETGDALVAVDAAGRVLATNEIAARRRIAVVGESLPCALGEATGEVLHSGSEADVELETADGRPYVVSPLRYEGSPVGALLRVTVRGAGARRGPGRPGPSARYDFDTILGESAPFRAAIELARSAARTELPVVVFGESGTGKELFAQAIHAASPRQAGPFVAVNCGSIPEQLVEAELFGYEPGAFTGARQGGSPGRFEDACGGTLFLDEVSELPAQAQTALLRLLQEKEVVRLGSSAPRPVDVRVVAATNKPLEDEVRARRFRRDLYYRLNVLSMVLPPLRERGGDVVLLARAFLAEAESEVRRSGLALADDALAALSAHDWPGNVRELRNALLRAAATAPAPRIRAVDLLLENGLREGPSEVAPRSTLQRVTTDAEREALLLALAGCGWNFARAAGQLGISRMKLYRLLKKYAISRPAAST